jgi:hypothetical protein
VQDVFEVFAFPYRTDDYGNTTVKLQTLISLLAQEGVLPITEEDLRLRVGTNMKDESSFIRINVPNTVVTNLLRSIKQEEQRTPNPR